MYETKNISLPTSAERFLSFLLFFYPTEYRKKYGQEIFILFQDLYHEELEKYGKIRIGFWLLQIGDITINILEEHIDTIQKQGMKKYLQQTLHINKYNIISGIFLLPVILMTSIEISSRIIQRDLIHYNRPVYAFMSHTPLYYTPVLFTWVIIFPLLSVVISLIPLFKSIFKKNASVFSFAFLRKNFITIAILVFGLGFLALIKLHDFLPCMVFGLTHLGLGQLSHIISVCKKA